MEDIMKENATGNAVKNRLREGVPSFGGWIQIGHPAVAELFANAGFDWIAVDCEHTDIGIAEFTSLARGMHGRKAIPMARVRENDTLAIRQVLDGGAQGVIVPLVNSAEDARRAVASAKFPPQGIRGSAFIRANEYGVRFREYAESANSDTLVIVMIETKEAVEQIDRIVAVEGVDGTFIGPYDLSASYGIAGDVANRVMFEARRSVLAGCRSAGKAAGIHLVTPTQDDIVTATGEGFTFIALGMDTVFLDQGARQVLRFARAAAGR
jgi:2-keto-3-deoxy-L-rhamnonate aldolase RhmA